MGELRHVRHPVSQTGGLIIALAEPAVIQHNQVDAHTRSLHEYKFPTLTHSLTHLLGHLYDVVVVDVKVFGLPGVQQHRGLGVRPVARQQAVQEESVDGAAHPAQPLARARQHHLGSIELATCTVCWY